METTSLLVHYSTIAADHDYTLLEGQPLSQLPDTSWYILSLPTPPIPLFSVSASSSSVSYLAFSLVVSGLLSGLRGLIWSSLCPLSPLPMVVVSCALPSLPSHLVHDTSWIVMNPTYVSHSSTCRWYPMLYPLLGALIGRISCPFPEESPSREPIFPFLQHLEHWHYASVHQKPSQPPRWPPLIWRPLILLLRLLRLLCHASIPLLIPDLLCWSHQICTDSPSIFFDLAPVHQMSIKWLCMTPLWLLGASLSPIWLPAFHISSYYTADSLPYQACWLICLLIPLLSNESFSLCLLICAYLLLTHWL